MSNLEGHTNKWYELKFSKLDTVHGIERGIKMIKFYFQDTLEKQLINYNDEHWHD